MSAITQQETYLIMRADVKTSSLIGLCAGIPL